MGWRPGFSHSDFLQIWPDAEFTARNGKILISAQEAARLLNVSGPGSFLSGEVVWGHWGAKGVEPRWRSEVGMRSAKPPEMRTSASEGSLGFPGLAGAPSACGGASRTACCLEGSPHRSSGKRRIPLSRDAGLNHAVGGGA